MGDELASPLLNLPAELRLRIFEYALAPTGVLSLTSTRHRRYSATPSVCPVLLLTCRQIYQEAVPVLYAENEVCITVDAHDTCSPTISETRLPQFVLEKIQRMCVILDCTDYFNASYADVDFTPFEALTSLKSLRVAMIYRKYSVSQTLGALHIATLRDFNVVVQILERIPADAKVEFGTKPGSQQNGAVLRLIDIRARGRGGVIKEASCESLHDAANGVSDLVQGCKSGKTAYVFTHNRAQHANLHCARRDHG